ncbi:MAG: helix-turn-helix transcriptional regulator [Fusicatenibacter sp.]|nr:helix-turn-helix transcriptional regulator [Fusicatenibacter sp.]
MNVYELNVSSPLRYHFTGKLQAPSENWKHDSLPLDEYELFVMTEGVLYLTYGNMNYTLREGETLLLPPLPKGQNIRKGQRKAYCSFYWLHFVENTIPPSGYKAMSVPGPIHGEYPYPVPRNTLAIPDQAKPLNADKLVVMMKQLQDSVRNHYDPVTLDYLTTSILCELHSQLYREYNARSSARPAVKQVYFDIIDYVKLNSTENLKVSDVANQFGYNEKYLSHLFSDIAGLSLKQFIMNVRMDTANYLLSDTNMSIAEIAKTLNFSDSHNFSKAFKKIAGMSPTEYRNAFSKRLLYHN